MKKIIFSLLLLIGTVVYAQETYTAEKIWRVNFINPSLELELPLSDNLVQSIALGVGYGGVSSNLASGTSGLVYVIAPFIDAQTKYFYNFKKRNNKGKNVAGNSGNFVSLRLLGRGPSIADNVFRKSDYDLGFGPSWGLQRQYGSIHFLFDVGPQFFVDAKGNTDFFPVIPQINVGYNF